MGSVSLPRLAIALWFASYCVISIFKYLVVGPGERIPIFWTIIHATVMMSVLLLFISLWVESGDPSKK